VAIDPSTARRPISSDHPPDENVVSTYRAITPLAIASLILGLAAIFSFLSLWFAISGALALVSGIMAIRAIRRLPEALTGERMANAGIALGLLFSLAAVTIDFVQVWIMDREATKFVRGYVADIQSAALEQALFLHADPGYRKEKTPEENIAQYSGSPQSKGIFEMETQGVRDMIKRIKSTPGQTVTLSRILNHAADGMGAYVEFVLILQGPKSQDFPAETQYGIVGVHGNPEGRVYAWKVQSTKFPATPPPGGF
jgi:ABC-type multidrug transport system fused ATPase/permease subunit